MADKEDNVKAVTSSPTAVTPQSLVTEDHVLAALISDKGTAARLTDWKVVDFTKKGDNYACVVTSVEVKYVVDGKNSEVVYVMKINAGKSFGSDNSIYSYVFEKESQFYLNLVPQINFVLKEIGHREINFPKCFHASLEKGKEIIVLEDLRPHGYKMVDRRSGLDEAHASLVVRELARLHAASLLLQDKTPGQDLGEKYPHLKQNTYYFLREFDAMLTTLKDSMIFSQDIIKKVGGYERVSAWIETIIPRLVDIFYEHVECGEPKVVCHGDCWINNLLFRYSEAGHPEDVMLLDLQIVQYTTPVIDLNYLLFSSMTGDVRKPNIETFLSSYYSTFSDIMEGGGQQVPFTQEQLLKDFKAKSIIGLIYAMMAVPVVLFETDGDVDSSKNTDDDLAEQLRETRLKAMDTLDTNPLLKTRLLTVFDEVMELGIIP